MRQSRYSTSPHACDDVMYDTHMPTTHEYQRLYTMFASLSGVAVRLQHTMLVYSYHKSVFFQIIVTFLSYISNSCHSFSKVALRLSMNTCALRLQHKDCPISLLN